MTSTLFKKAALASSMLACLSLMACNNSSDAPSATGGQVTSSGVKPAESKKLALADCAMVAQEAFMTRNDIADGNLNPKGNLLLRFVQFSDDHVIDDDGQATNGASFSDSIEPTFESAQRLQEEFSDEVLNNMVANVNECQKTYPSEFMIVTGDSADLTTIAETRRFIDNIDGTFDQMSAFEESCRAQFPAGTPEQFLVEQCTRFTGRGTADTQAEDIDITNPLLRTTTTRSVFQLVNTSAAVLGGRNAAGEYDPTRQTFNRAAGLPEVLRCKEGDQGCPNEALKLPWMVAFGNHDGYLRGTAAFGTGLNEASMATGRRHIQEQSDFIAEFYKSTSLPLGHGFNFADEARRNDDNLNNDGYYAFDSKDAKFRMIVLNTIIDGRDPRLPTDKLRNPMALADGTIDKTQFDWLKDELAKAWNNKQMVIVFSHHPDLTFAEYGTFADALALEVYATDLDAELASYPNVIAWVAGHTHRHRIRAFAVASNGMGDNGKVKVPVVCKAADASACKGFWQIESASLIDFPQEQRLFEIVDNKDGTGVIHTPVIQHTYDKSKVLAEYDDRCQFYFTDPNSYQALKSSEADLAGLCAFGGTRQGEAKDRNVDLVFKMPSFK